MTRIQTAALIACGLLVALAPGCTPKRIELTPQGQQVVVVNNLRDIAGCEELGLVVAASSSAVSNEDTRTINARNHAGEMGGNRILPGQINLLGEQEFRVFQCR